MLVALQNDYEARYEEKANTIRINIRHGMQDKGKKECKRVSQLSVAQKSQTISQQIRLADEVDFDNLHNIIMMFRLH